MSHFNGNPPGESPGTLPGAISCHRLPKDSSRKGNNARLNDQLVPKPTDTNVASIMTKTATPKEHPYSSHICRFAMFPSFRSPDDPETGIRAASQTFPHPRVPSSAPEMNVLCKTIGGPHRHEIIATPMKGRQRAVTWTGTHGFLEEVNQVFYPAPPKTVLPNPELRAWDLSLSERTCNMLKNMERALWLTSYQVHFTGSGPANPLKFDDFREKMSVLRGNNPQTAPLQERSCPAFVPSRPKQGRRRRLERNVSRCTCSPTSSDFLQTCAEESQSTARAPIGQPRESTALSSHFSPDLHRRGLYRSDYTSKDSLLHSSHGADPDPASNIQYCHDFQKFIPGQDGLHLSEDQPLREFKTDSEQTSRKGFPHETADGELRHDHLLPRPPTLSDVPSVDRGGVMGSRGTTLSLLDLQSSFSKSEAHRNFNNCVTRAQVNLRDNVVHGKKHNFNGINCNQIHG